MSISSTRKTDDRFDCVVVGAGFAGLYMLHRLRGLGLNATVFETGSDVGGTWFWNRYPGARCDAESLVYSYSFSPEIEQEFIWSERYATQPEILRYLNFVADRFDLKRDIRFNQRVTTARYDETAGEWIVTTGSGASARARYFVMATGCLSVGRVPEIAGLENFAGSWYHTGAWPHDGVDFAGKRVGLIGTGSSAIQAVPMIAREAAQLTVFQRTPNYSVPAVNRRLTEEDHRWFKENRSTLREHSRWGLIGGSGDVALADEERANGSRSALAVTPEEVKVVFEDRWRTGGAYLITSFADIMVSDVANDTLADFVRDKIHGIVKDPALAGMLAPTNYPIGAKRICVDTGYYETFNRDNVTLVDLNASAIEQITTDGVKTTEADYALDVLVFATGFDAMTGALTKVDIRGRNDVSLREEWAAGPRSYLGVTVSGFPNMFTITGPGSPSVLSNVVVSIEQHVDWISGLLAYMTAQKSNVVEPDAQVEREWMQHVNETANSTLFMKGNSWYLGANVPGKPRVFMPYIGGVGNYRKICNEIAEDGYRGFHISTIEQIAAAE